jgi:acyl-CoA synthetase (NDP forming)
MAKTAIDWDALFRPRSIAVVGASTKKGLTINVFFPALVEAKFQGPLYPVNRHAAEVMGYPAYRSLLDIPQPVDYAIIAVPREHLLAVVRDCITKKVAAAHIFTSGFGETRTPEGRRLNAELKQLVTGRIRIIGPNCMGIYHPGARMAYLPGQSMEVGDIGFISQSGGHNSLLIETATSQGLYFSKAISIGNSIDLGINDFLEYLGQDDETGVIGVYAEGVAEGQGRRFFELLENITPRKPVMIMKAGRGESGVRAAASHTGSMAGTYALWEGMAKQANAIMVDDYTEMVDFIWAYRCLAQVPGLRAAVVSGGGGNSVWCGDTLSSMGFSLPALSPEVQKKMLETTDAVGTIAQNPVDPNMSAFDPEVHCRVFEILAEQPDIDVLVNIGIMDFLYQLFIKPGVISRTEVIQNAVSSLAMIRRKVRKPFVAVSAHVSENAELTAINNEIRYQARKEGVPCYSSLERMAKAVYRLYHYYRRRERAAGVQSGRTA